MVEHDERKVRRFFQGLQDDIRRHLSTLTLTMYGEVFAKAVIYKKELERGAMSRQRTFSQASKAVLVKSLLRRQDHQGSAGQARRCEFSIYG
ncbi:hypothetical protein Nepgr_007916 [Nepenthes gracilis]|uniref:Uncharacterized protein n=1 Tax=Nepenthes gracilis TaxID=150966 RepID=A0AAD3XIZ0_NEPGR|nr:hypothetical protein Nepgr_007916 [Nepenthes gracilis]